MQSTVIPPPNAFRVFSGEHLLAMAAILFLSVGLALLPRLRRMQGGKDKVRVGMAWLLALNEIAWFAYAVITLKATWRDMLPLHLCSVSLVVVIVGLAWPRQTLFEFAYFFGIGGALQAILTPDLVEGFPSYATLKFFVSHGGIIAGVSYMIGGLGFRPYPVSILRAIGMGFLYLGVAGLANWMLKTNYGYLAEKPEAASLLNYLGPWPWYIGSMVVLSTATILVMYLPFFVADQLRKSS